MSDDKEIFKEAAAKSIEESLLVLNKSLIKKDLSLVEQAKDIVENDKGWSKLMKRMDSDLADRFMDELDAMSGREFVRNYLKALEYTKPKITRQEAGMSSEDDDNTLTIVIKKSSHNYENNIKTIDIESDD